MTPLDKLIREMIRRDGPMGVDRFMEVALAHPEHGYYITRDPLGRGGDFTTAPEISQMFGEVIGAWAADLWLRMGSPARFVMLECGPGRGTLMQDALRATAKVPGFHEAMALVLMETSPVLRAAQKERLAAYKPVWVEGLAQVAGDVPLIVVANEFLDALPVKQFVSDGKDRRERVVELQGDVLALSAGDIYEVAPVREAFVDELCARLVKTRGGALLIDYGHGGGVSGDTLQAVRDHRYVDVLADVGEADLTSHVDFGALARVAAGHEVRVTELMEQGRFLEGLGIRARAAALCRNADARQRREIEVALQRLTAPEAMGHLFKVMGIEWF